MRISGKGRDRSINQDRGRQASAAARCCVCGEPDAWTAVAGGRGPLFVVVDGKWATAVVRHGRSYRIDRSTAVATRSWCNRFIRRAMVARAAHLSIEAVRSAPHVDRYQGANCGEADQEKAKVARVNKGKSHNTFHGASHLRGIGSGRKTNVCSFRIFESVFKCVKRSPIFLRSRHFYPLLRGADRSIDGWID